MSKSCRKVLAGDVGGTKSNLGLYLRKDSGTEREVPAALELLAEARYENSQYGSFEEIVSLFLNEHSNGKSSKICCATFGIAATITDNRCSMTNLSWQIDGAKLSADFGFKSCFLINDLAATAWGLGSLSSNDLHTLQAPSGGCTKPRGTRALIAAGTGLGEALIVNSVSSPAVVIATEGGHTDFAPTDDVQIELLKFLSKKYRHVSYERVVSGSALKDIFDFFVLRRGGTVNAELAQRFSTEAAGAVITELGLLGAGTGDKDCVDTLNLFVSVYGAEAGNLALKSLPYAGVFIGGGIAPKILRAMEDSFIRSFVAKGRFETLMKSLPVYIILNEKTALLGAAVHASAGGGSRKE